MQQCLRARVHQTSLSGSNVLARCRCFVAVRATELICTSNSELVVAAVPAKWAWLLRGGTLGGNVALERRRKLAEWRVVLRAPRAGFLSRN